MQIRSSKGKRAKRYQESKVLKRVRAHDEKRDGHCRAWHDFLNDGESLPGVTANDCVCEGPSELAHLENQRRFKTRGMKPELRHTTAGTAMLCQKHHRAYDKRDLRVQFLSNAGADGECRWSLR